MNDTYVSNYLSRREAATFGAIWISVACVGLFLNGFVLWATKFAPIVKEAAEYRYFLAALALVDFSYCLRTVIDKVLFPIGQLWSYESIQCQISGFFLSLLGSR